ncbi:phage tail protein [Ochrobactrum sp. Marseille-Q0166]|uniref:phage tail protein n=1 Tax=Ochrobactrum sp. Marseille-Q0166 TaxID=2761105 RepID=UPI0016555EB1|nr:phage tail protein [Ochrobactrum sp. Marseille-Q0166]MBC8718180.1 hypothetical protein [Ochrobactrum sp. Marseille-Q0166]
MKILRVAAWVISLTLCMMLPAHAGPVGAAIGAVVGLLKAGGIAATLIKLAFGIAFQLGSSLLAKMSAKKQTQPGIVGQVQLGGDKSLSFIVGTYATAGHLEFVNSFGKVDDVENAILTQVITVSDLPVQSIGNRVFVNGETCNRDPSIVTSSEAAKLGATSYPIAEYKYSRWWFTFLKYYLGDQTAADAELVAKFAGDERPWLSDMVGRGVAYVIATAEYERHLMTAIPAFRFEVQGIKLYDPRKDSSVGGNGPHRWGVESTYEWTDNPIVIIYNILRGIHYKGEFIWGGTVKPWGFPLSGWMAAMNECDILVQNENGQFEKQFRCGYEIRTLDQDPMDVIEELLKSCNGRISESGGIYSVRVGPPGLPVAFLSDGEFVISKEREFDAFPGLENTFNGVTGTWPSPDAAWEMKDAPQRRFPEYEAEDEGRILLADVEFNAVPFANQVQRLMMALAKANRRFRKHIVTLHPWAAVLDPFDVIALTSPKEGYQNKHFEIMGLDDQPNVTQVASITEVDPSDYIWNADRDTLPWSVGPLTPNWPAAQIMVGWGVQPAELKDAEGISRRPSIEVFFAANMTDVRAVRVKVQLASTLEIVFDGEIPYGDPDYDNPSRSVILNGIFLPDEDYAVQGVYVPYSGRQVIPSAWMPVKTPRILLIDKDIGEGAITAAKLAAASVEFDKIADEAIRLNHFANNITPIEIGEQMPTQGNFDGRQFYNTADGKMYTWNGAEWVKPETGIADGSVTSVKIADNAVTANKIVQGAISASKFASSIKPVEIVSALPTTDNVVGRVVYLTTDSKLYRYTPTGWVSTVASSDITGQIEAAQIAALEATKITGTIVGTQIADNAISTPKLAASAVVAGKIAAGAVETDKLAAGAVTTGKLDALAVTSDKLAANSVTAGKIAAAAVSTDQLAANAVIASKIAANAITGDKLVANSITARELILTDWTNLVPDSQVKDIAGSWTLRGDWITTTTGDVNVDVKNIFVHMYTTGATGYGNYMNSSRFAVSLDRKYVLSCQARAFPSGTADMLARIHYYDKDGAALATYSTVLNTPTSPTFTRFSGDFAPPTVASTAEIRVYSNRSGSNARLDVTSFQVRVKAGAELIVDGGITANHLSAGSVTTDKLAANAITAGKIAAGAISAAQLAAGAVTADKIAAGSIATDKLAVGISRNVLQNSQFTAGLSTWAASGNPAGWVSQFSLVAAGSSWAGPLNPTLRVWQSNAVAEGYIDVRQNRPDQTGWKAYCYPVNAGDTWEASVYTSAHRCDIQLRIEWRMADGATAYSSASVNAAFGGSSTNPETWQRLVVRSVAPANAVAAGIHIRKLGTRAGSTDSYMFLYKPFLAQVPPYVTEAAPWSDGGFVLIDGSGIVAGAITADKMNVNNLAALSVDAGNIKAGTLSSSDNKFVINLNEGYWDLFV